MIPGFGKPSIVLGSAASCDIVLTGPGVAPEHARVSLQNGKLVFQDAGTGATVCNGQPMPSGGQAAFDFRTTFACGSVAVPLNHPALALMLMSRGQAPAPAGHLIVGREASKANLVIQHGSVSSQHATITLPTMQIVDHQSTSGTYVGANKIAPNTPTHLDPNGLVAFGPVPVPVSVLMQIAQAYAGGPIPGAPHAPSGPPPAGAPGGPGGGGGAGGGGGGGAGGKKHKTVVGQLDFGKGKEVTTIGRTPENDIRVDHPQVSSRHAVLLKRGGKMFIEDRKSANGTFVRGQRIPPGQPVEVGNGEKVFIGPMPLVISLDGEGGGGEVYIEDRGQWAGRPLFEIEAWRLRMEVPDREDSSATKTLLDDISFKALPGDMIALMGPSGAGKTTLLMALNGYLPPTSGVVRINGEDLYAIYDNLRGSIGYVPQDDLVHPELTVYEAVRYSAKFRLPPDFSEEEIERRVQATLAQLSLDSLANLQIGRPEKKVLSGGQRKRVNIALELVTDPVILFLDEPTSGLAADDTTALITLLSDLAKNTGKTIIMTIHQPAKDEFEKFNLTLLMGFGGVPMYYGPTSPDAYRFFGNQRVSAGGQAVDNPRDMFDCLREREGPIFDQMKARNPAVTRNAARNQAAKMWAQEFTQTPTYNKMYSGPRSIGSEQGRKGVMGRNPDTSGQLGLLLSRYFKIKTRDTAGTAIMLLQAPIIGVLLAFVFGGQQDAVPFWCLGALQELLKKYPGNGGALSELMANMKATSDHTGAAFFMVVSAVWFGTSNAAREIVSERAIYMRERMVNLGLFNYVMSKFILLSFFCVVQCTMLLAIVFFALGFHGGPVAFAVSLANMVSVALCAVGIGLMLSTIVDSSEAAMGLTPIALIPQVVLGGLMVPMTTNPTLKWVMYVVPARWGFQGVISQERAAIADNPAWIIDLKQSISSEPDFITAGKFKCATAQLASDTFSGAWGFVNHEETWLSLVILLGMTFAIMLVLLVVLKRRDPV